MEHFIASIDVNGNVCVSDLRNKEWLVTDGFIQIFNDYGGQFLTRNEIDREFELHEPKGTGIFFINDKIKDKYNK